MMSHDPIIMLVIIRKGNCFRCLTQLIKGMHLVIWTMMLMQSGSL